MEHGERAHKLAKVYHVILLRVEHLKHAVSEQVAALLCLEERQRELVLVDAAILAHTQLVRGVNRLGHILVPVYLAHIVLVQVT